MLPVDFKKFFRSEKKENHRRKKGAFLWWESNFGILRFLVPLLLIALIFIGAGFTGKQDFVLSAFRFNKPKPISQSSKTLPSDIQQAIEEEAKQEIIQERATALVATNTLVGSVNLGQNSGINTANTLTTVSSPTVRQPSFFSNAVYPFQLLFATSPADKAKLRLAHIDQEIQQLQALLKSDSSDNAVNQAVGVIQNIGQETGQVVADKNAQTDREILTLQIEQYTRLQLILQKIEDTLPIDAYLKINAAREKYLVSGAREAINTAPNLGVINNIGIGETRKIVGSDFAELKAIETLTDINSGLTPQAQQNLAGVQKELVLQFEKRMLALPADVRTRKLQNYISLSYGNPLTQVESFNQMQHLLTDRDMILNVESLKEIALKKLEARIFEIKTKSTRDRFTVDTFNTPQSLDVLTQVQLDASTLTNAQEAKQIADVEADSQSKIVQTFGSAKSLNTFFAPELNKTTNLLDTAFVDRLATTLQNSSTVSPEVKANMQAIQQKIIHNFAKGITQKSFLTTPKITYNPVSENADVRLLLPAPYATPLLEELRGKLSGTDKAAITIAEKAESNILVTHLLTQVNDPTVFGQYQQYITNTPLVKQTLGSYVPQRFYTALDQKKIILDKQRKADKQVLYEKMQQIVQQIFLNPNTIGSETNLPTQIQQEITTFKQEIPSNSIPTLITPSDVKLPQFATLPQDVQDAFITAAKDKISSEGNKNPVDITTEAKDLGVSVPVILPGNPLYPLESVIRAIPILLTSDPIQKAETLIKIDNEKTIEAAKLVAESQSTASVNMAIKTLESVKQDLEKLKANVDQVKQVGQTEPAKVDVLVNQVIDDGVARQTVISSIESNVHGDAYVAVEKVRQDILKDGVDTLLAVTDNNVQKLTNKLETIVTSNTETPATTVANDIKAVELLNEIARTEPQSAQKILKIGEATIAASLEKTLLSQPSEIRTQEVSLISQETTGNPVRQFEALDVLKDDFKNPQTILLAEGLKDKATQNLQARISEIPDANTQNTFADQVIGNMPQDLKAITQIETEVAPPQNAGVVEVLSVVQKIENIKADIEQNIIDTYKDKPGELAKTDFFTHNPTPDVVDVKVAQDVATAFQSSPEVQPAVVEVAKQEETKIIDTFVTNVSKPEFQISLTASTNTSVTTQPSPSVNTTTQTSIAAQTNESQLAAETLNPIPETLIELVDLKQQLPLTEQAKIDVAINIEVGLIQDHLTNQVNDPSTFQTYVAQITQNPAVEAIVTQVGGQAFQQAVEQKTQIIDQQATSDQTQLTTTVAQIQQDVFSAPVSSPSTVEQSLPQPIQQEIQQIKQEVQAQQIPSVNVSTETSVSTTVTAQSVDTTPTAAPIVEQPQASAPAPAQPAAPAVQAPAPAAPAPEAPAPQTQSAPEQPAAPAAPGLSYGKI